jgi:hypothetical protein
MPGNYSYEEFLLCGPRYLKIWQFNQADKLFTLNSIPIEKILKENEFIVDAAFIQETPYLGVITSRNNLIYIKSKEIMQVLEIKIPENDIQDNQSSKKASNKYESSPDKSFFDSSTNLKPKKPYRVSCICPLKSGFIIGFQGVNILTIVEIDKDEDAIVAKCKFKLLKSRPPKNKRA